MRLDLGNMATRVIVVILLVINGGLVAYAVTHHNEAGPPVSRVLPNIAPTSPEPAPTARFTVDAATIRPTLNLPGAMFAAASTRVAWRATGSCATPANLQITRNGGLTWTFAIQPAAHVLAVQATDEDSATAIGADAFCRPTRYVTHDGGRSWKPRSLEAVWFAIPTGVYGPVNKLTKPCSGRVLNLSSFGNDALVMCSQGVLRTDDGGRHWSSAGLLPHGRAENLTITAQGHAVLLMAKTRGCHGLLAVLSDNAGASWRAGECLRVAQPPAAVGLAPNGEGQVSSLSANYSTTDYGKSWN